MKEKIKFYAGWHQVEMSFKFFLATMIILTGFLGLSYSVQVYPKIFRTEAALNKGSEIEPGEAVQIRFSQPVFVGNYESQIKIFPETDFSLAWGENNRTLTIRPKNNWQLETNYQIQLPAGKNMVMGPVEEKNLSFSTMAYPKIVEFSPKTGSQDVVLDAEDPVTLTLDKSAKDFFIKFSSNPETEMAFESNQEKNWIRLLPQENLKAGENYEIKVFIKYIKEDDSRFKEIYNSKFVTLPKQPDTWDNNLTVRLEQAKKYTQPKIKEGKYIDINLANQVMTLFAEGKLVDSFIVSSGKRGMDTPKGTFSIHNKAPRVWSKKYGLYMPYWMAVASDGSFGIHELPEWPGGYKEGANHLGIPVSHGCIRLGVGPAKFTYDWTEVGTPVVIY
jgi:lipoprotein-anchoring transpeptidase ErfK/SrfK